MAKKEISWPTRIPPALREKVWDACKGDYQRGLLTGSARWDGSELTNRVGVHEHTKSYHRSRAALLSRIAEAGWTHRGAYWHAFHARIRVAPATQHEAAGQGFLLDFRVSLGNPGQNRWWVTQDRLLFYPFRQVPDAPRELEGPPRLFDWLDERAVIRILPFRLAAQTDAPWDKFPAARILRPTRIAAGGGLLLGISDRATGRSGLSRAILPHHLRKPAIQLSTGYKAYFLNGVFVDSKYFQPEITQEEIAKLVLVERNAQVRSEVITELLGGFGPFATMVGAKRIEMDEFGALYRIDDYPEEPMVLVRVIDATKQTPHWLRVPPDITTPKAAVAWTFGIPEGRYKPQLET